MAQDLVVFEQHLNQLRPTFNDVLPKGFPVDRIIRTVMLSLQRTVKLQDCTQQSVMTAALSLGILGLEADGMTGQGFLLPFANNAQAVIGYKGYNTLAARNKYAIRGALVYEGDRFDVDLARPDPFIHKPSLEPVASRRIIGCWSLASSFNAPPIPSWLRLDELEAVRLRSPAKDKKDSPWNDLLIGRPAMYEKTTKRRLSRSMPLSPFLLAAGMEEAHEERGLHSWIDPRDGITTENHVAGQIGMSKGADLSDIATADRFPINKGGTVAEAVSIIDWEAKMMMVIQGFSADKAKLQRFRELNGAVLSGLAQRGFDKEVKRVDEAFTKALST